VKSATSPARRIRRRSEASSVAPLSRLLLAGSAFVFGALATLASTMDHLQRDLLPLPVLWPSSSAADFGSDVVSRSVARRRQCKGHWRSWASAGIGALNELGGEGRPVPEQPNSAQRAALGHIEAAYASMGKPPPASSLAGALGELCHGASPYEDLATHVQPYIKDRVSWPEASSRPMPMLDGLPGDLSWIGQWKAHLLRPPEEAAALREASEVKRPHMDPRLKTDQKTYGDFLDTLHRAGMLGWRRARMVGSSRPETGELGAFFVLKKD